MISLRYHASLFHEEKEKKLERNERDRSVLGNTLTQVVVGWIATFYEGHSSAYGAVHKARLL